MSSYILYVICPLILIRLYNLNHQLSTYSERNTTNANREINQTLENQNEIYVTEIDELVAQMKSNEAEIVAKEQKSLDLVLKVCL